MLVLAYDGTLNGDWVAHYAIRFAANTPGRRLRLLHVRDGEAGGSLDDGLIFAQVGNLVGRRYERRSGLDAGVLRNPLFVLGIALELAFAVAALQVPSLGRVLGTGPVAPWLLGLAALGAPVLFLADWARKRWAGGAPVRDR